MTLRSCVRCNNTFPATSEFFCKNPKRKDGLHSYCRSCLTEYQRDRRKRHKEGFKRKKIPRVDLEALPIPKGSPLRICTKCERSFPQTPKFFYRNHKREDGFQTRCKECLLEEQAARRSGKRVRKFVPRSLGAGDHNGQRFCHHCEEWKSLDRDYFKPNPLYLGGFVRQCRKCVQKRIKKARREDWANRLRGYAMGRHKRYADPCDLTVEHIEMLWDRQRGLCAWFKVPMVQDMDEGDRLRLVTLDRVDSSKGYTQNNTVLVCKAANQCRGNTPMEVFEIFLREVRSS